MTLEQLRMLVKIADKGGVLAAAEALHRTQPTISVAIKKLEGDLGLMLLDRSCYRASLTPAGETLCQQARIILKQCEALSAMAQHFAQGNEPEVRIAIEASCPLPLVLDILRECERKFPATKFNLRGDTLWGALERVQLDEADLAISPWFEDNLDLESFPLTSAALITVAAPQFMANFSHEQLDLEDLKDYVQVVVRDSSRQPRPQKFGYFSEGRHWHVNDHITKKEIILAGMGWGRLHEHLIAEELRTGKLVPLTIHNYPGRMDISICMARMRGKPVGPVAATLWSDFQKFANSKI